MNDELDTFGAREADLEKLAGLVGADEHREFVEREHSDRVAVRVCSMSSSVTPCLRALVRMTGSTGINIS
jgi:hypothetical protein